MMRPISRLLVPVSFVIILCGCDPCRHSDPYRDINLPTKVKSLVYQFPEGTRWIFEAGNGDRDTAYLGKPEYYLIEGGYVEERERCTKVRTQNCKQVITITPDADGLEKFNQNTNELGVQFLYSPIAQHLQYSTNDYINTEYQSTLVVNGTTLTDVEPGQQTWSTIHPTAPYRAYWSLSKGLVRYEYQQTDGSFIVYERIDL